MMIFSFFFFIKMFSVATPEDYWCKIPKSDVHNLTQEDVHAILPQEVDAHNRTVHSKCTMYDVHYAKTLLYKNFTDLRSHTPPLQIVPCQYGWDYNRSTYQSTIVMDWNLVSASECF